MSEKIGRRALLTKMGAAAAVFTMAMGDFLGVDTPLAHAAPDCCDLLYPPGVCGTCSGGGKSWKSWYCYSTFYSRVLKCGECTAGADCYSGNITKSCWWFA